MNINKFITPSSLGVPVFYIGLGFLWITASDLVLNIFVNQKNLSSQAIFYINLTKGIGFILLTGFILYLTDIRKARQMEAKITKTEKNLYALINNTSDLMWSVSKDMHIIYANDAFKQLISKMMGKKWDMNEDDMTAHFNNGVLAQWKVYFTRALQGESFCVEESYDLPDKSKGYSEICFNPITDELGNITGAGCYSRDITQRKLNELQIAEQNKKLMEIAWVQSHEVRGPVTTIMALNNMLNRQNLSDIENIELLNMLDITTKKLDVAIREIVEKASEEKAA